MLTVFSYSKLQMLNSPLTSLSIKIMEKTWILSRGRKYQLSHIKSGKWLKLFVNYVKGTLTESNT